MGVTHLKQHHLLQDVPTATAAHLQHEGCRWCRRPIRAVKERTGRSSLTAHEAQCSRNPRKRAAREAAAALARGEKAAAPKGGGSAAAPGQGGSAAVASAPPPGGAAAAAVPPGGGAGARARAITADPSAWARAREEFLRRVAPTADHWAPLVASGARTEAHVPSALGGA